MLIPLVQVGHGRNEPAVNRFLHINLRSIRIFHRSKLIAGLLEASTRRITATLRLLQPIGQVQPVVGRHIQCPRMLKTTMVEDHIHHNLQSFGMRLIAESPVIVITSETWIYTVVVRRCIAMIGGIAILIIRRIVFQHRGEPKCRNP